ncbi:CDP-glycerol glycerophosphotransferase family protein [Staphylococcus xylosus]|uniref:CDP-glycerol glycerophosphotransferase family protein n=1 Tax=Staphylococcus xylosus TaxID=1288 RepID=A0A939NDV7_STAXY|nr:CDP-glycerol glycerophosphotransferase family protein [Staphylococcus xylosus]
MLQATHIIAPNQFMVDKQKSAYSIGGIHVGEVAKVGYPRIDTTLNTTEAQGTELKRMNIGNDKRIVLYAPTWRGETKESNGFDIDKLIYDLKNYLK